MKYYPLSLEHTQELQLNKLYRNFIILQEDERGYSTENDKTLSGYSKIEAKGEKCKISFYAQNLRSDSDDYYGLVIFNKKDTKRLVNLGNIAITEGGKIEVTKEYFRNDIGGLGLSYDKISGAAIVKLRAVPKEKSDRKLDKCGVLLWFVK